MERSFTVFFRKRTQFFNVYLHETSHETFKRKGGGRWGYFIPRWEHSKKGWFGDIHLVASRVRVDVVTHEIDHLRLEWIFSNRVGLGIKNEEWFCRFGDELIRNFYKEYDKHIGKKKR